MSQCEPPRHLISSVYRSIRKWWVALPPNRRQLVREYTWQHRWNLAACAGVAVVIITLFLLTHLDEAPLTGRTRLLLFSRESYSELAEQASQAVREGRGGGLRQGRCGCVYVCVRV